MPSDAPLGPRLQLSFEGCDVFVSTKVGIIEQHAFKLLTFLSEENPVVGPPRKVKEMDPSMPIGEFHKLTQP